MNPNVAGHFKSEPPPVSDPFALVREDLDEVETLLADQIASEAGLILDVARYIINNGGKRFRPAVHLLACKMLGVEDDRRIKVAAALECIHTATLLHDDVVDAAPLRRGEPAAHVVWGAHIAVLVGDFLFATSVQWILSTRCFELLDRFADACKGMAEGEAYQLSVARTRRLAVEDYLHVVGLKTAGLISLASSSPAMIGNSDQHLKNALDKYGRHVGMAFQIVDDALDYCSEQDELGKAIGKDLEEGKITLPMLHALEKAGTEDRKALDSILESDSLTSDELKRAQEIIHRYDGIEHAREQATMEVEKAKKALSIFPSSSAKDALFELAEYTVKRRR